VLPLLSLTYRWQAAALAQLGHRKDANDTLRRAQAISRQSFLGYVRKRPSWFRLENHEYMLDGLRKAGWRSDRATGLIGVLPAVLRFHTVAHCTPCRLRPSHSVQSNYRVRSRTETGVLHAISTRRIDGPIYGVQNGTSTQNMACITHCTP
jgi:hypothetical protein